MKQNVYDNAKFVNEYDNMRKENKGINANDVIEIPIFRKMMPDVLEKRILDLGCGYGENGKYFKELGASYILGTDISNHMIDIANKDNKIDGVDYKVMAMEDISSLKEKFDIVISSLAIHYIEDYDKLIKDIYNLLNDNGVLLFSMEHPIVSSLKFTDKIDNHKIEIDGKKYALVGDYNRCGLRDNPWYDVKVIRYHRNFSTIINTLIKNKFIIDEINECEITEDMVKKNPKYANQYDSPYYLFVKCHK